jgi:hypothetical protein
MEPSGGRHEEWSHLQCNNPDMGSIMPPEGFEWDPRIE